MSCPAGFVLAPNGLACVVKCPSTYTFQMQSGVPSCVMTGTDGNVIASFGLTSVATVKASDAAGFASTSYADWGEDFGSAYQDFQQNLAIASATAGRANQVSVAFQNLQTAEDARGTAGGEAAYERARVAYYTLTKGDSWLESERARVANTEAQPIVDDLASQYTSVKNRVDQQQKTIDVINGLKDRVLSVKDDLGFSVNTFQKQIEDIKNQINIDKKNQNSAVQITTSWVDTFLNWLIAIITILCIVLLVRRFSRRGGLERMRRETEFYKAQTALSRAKSGLVDKPYGVFESLLGKAAEAPAAPKV